MRSASFLKPTSSVPSPPAASSRFSHSSPGVTISVRTRCADLRIAQPRRPRVVAAFLHPRRHRRVEAGRAGGVGVHVGRDRRARPCAPPRSSRSRRRASASSAGPRLSGDRSRRGCAPRARSSASRRSPRAAGCLRCACARCTCRPTRTRPSRARRARRSSRTPPACRSARSSRPSRLLASRGARRRASARARRRRRAVVEPDVVGADRRRAHERRDVGRHAARSERVEIFAERGPRDSRT